MRSGRFPKAPGNAPTPATKAAAIRLVGTTPVSATPSLRRILCRSVAFTFIVAKSDPSCRRSEIRRRHTSRDGLPASRVLVEPGMASLGLTWMILTRPGLLARRRRAVASLRPP